MLLPRLTLLTLLIAASGWLVSGENMITCHGSVQHLTCDTGLIKVRSTIYGRTTRDTCNDRPAPQIANTNCTMAISTIADRCNGLRECEVKTDLLGNPDPCFGTFKYYNTTYDCIGGQNIVICDRGYRTLDCGAGYIQIINANYGRADRVTCVNGQPSSALQNTNCYAPSTFSNVSSMCNGKATCTLDSSNTIFRDPCFGTAKYLSVSYFCHMSNVTCEGNTTVLTCGIRRINVISANYGRNDSTTCSSGRPANQISNTNCSTPDALNKVAARCNGLSSCSVSATNAFFSDPCYGTYKYMTTEYYCY